MTLFKGKLETGDLDFRESTLSYLVIVLVTLHWAFSVSVRDYYSSRKRSYRSRSRSRSRRQEVGTENINKITVESVCCSYWIAHLPIPFTYCSSQFCKPYYISSSLPPLNRSVKSVTKSQVISDKVQQLHDYVILCWYHC